MTRPVSTPRLFAALATALALVPAPAFAQSNPGEERVKAACNADLQKVCPSAIGKPEEVKACLRANIMRVSAPCRDAAMAAR